MRSLVVVVVLVIVLAKLNEVRSAAAQGTSPVTTHLVQPGDTWTALAWRYNVKEEVLRSTHQYFNRHTQPAIGQSIELPGPVTTERTGTIVTSNGGGLLQLAAAHGVRPWVASILNGQGSPYHPLLYKAIFLPDESGPPKQLPAGVRSMEVSRAPALPGQALAIRGLTNDEFPVRARLAGSELVVSRSGARFVALGGTGAFFSPGHYPLEITVADAPVWIQPWLVAPREWTFEEITYTGQAATIDADTIRLERERLFDLWSQYGDQPYWSTGFVEPLQDYLDISSFYGARRSYSGGPYDRYHEGLDFSAYGGTPVSAPAAGIIALAEPLAARGGAVIIDHGLGVFSGYYHLSEVLAQQGQLVNPGDVVGRVGSTGLSTGNHLHWDLLVAGTWVDPAAWVESDLACWIMDGLGSRCPSF